MRVSKQDKMIVDLFDALQETITELSELGIKRAPRFRALTKRVETYIDREMKVEDE